MVPHLHGLTLFGRVSGEQVLGGLLRSTIAGVVDVVEGPELSAEGTACEFRLAAALVRDRGVVIRDPLHRLPRFIVEEERVSLLRDVLGRTRRAGRERERRDVRRSLP